MLIIFQNNQKVLYCFAIFANPHIYNDNIYIKMHMNANELKFMYAYMNVYACNQTRISAQHTRIDFVVVVVVAFVSTLFSL